jgi:hypothetical protein
VDGIFRLARQAASRRVVPDDAATLLPGGSKRIRYKLSRIIDQVAVFLGFHIFAFDKLVFLIRRQSVPGPPVNGNLFLKTSVPWVSPFLQTGDNR